MKKDPVLAAGACVLRRFRASDADDLVAAANHRAVWRNLRDAFPHPYTRADAETWLALAVVEDPITHLAIEVEGRAAGGVGVRLNDDVQRFSAEIGYWLGPERWGRGVMTAAVGAFAPWIMDELGLTRLYADVFAWNPASARVLEKCGFEREGVRRRAAFKDGTFVDAYAYALVRG